MADADLPACTTENVAACVSRNTAGAAALPDLIRTVHGSLSARSPAAYRRKWGLLADCPMIAPAYAERRSDFAKRIGLGKGVRRRS